MFTSILSLEKKCMLAAPVNRPNQSFQRAVKKLRFLPSAEFGRQGKHIVMSDGRHILTIPRHNPVNAFTLGGIVHDAGLAVDRFKELL